MIWGVSDDSSLVSNPGIVMSVKLDPKIGVVCLNEFDRDGPSTWSVKVISCHGQTTVSSRVRGSRGSGISDEIYEDGFRRGVVPRREIGHVRRHVTRVVTRGDYTSRRDLESNETLARDLETFRDKGN